jgi:antitoxin (DNA-binding transcriptional repressor) of toxin-antitoxin stability system
MSLGFLWAFGWLPIYGTLWILVLVSSARALPVSGRFTMWPLEATLSGMVKTINIRALKDRLSAYLRDVQRGDVILVTDRGRVVAEIRLPSVEAPAGPGGQKLRRLATEGVVKLGLPNRSDAYRSSGVSVPDEVVDDALSWTRGAR